VLTKKIHSGVVPDRERERSNNMRGAVMQVLFFVCKNPDKRAREYIYVTRGVVVFVSQDVVVVGFGSTKVFVLTTH